MHMLTLAEIDQLPSRVLAEPSRSITPVNPSDPARLGYPVTLPIEIALRTSSTQSVCESYGIDDDEWELIKCDPTFQADLQRAMEMLKEEGMSFRVKAKLQAEELLKTSWRMIHDVNAPPAVRSDLIKATMRWAQYDVPSSGQQGVPGSGFHISINFSGDRAEPRLING
jgi:hypothetical protein